MSNSKLTLYYFDATFRAEPIRCALAAFDLEYQDVRYDFDNFVKTMKSMSPTGQLPMLEIDGASYVEGLAILYYVCRLAGMVSQDPLEMLKHDMIANRSYEFTSLTDPIFFASKEDRPATLIKVTDKVKEFLSVVEGMVKNHAGEPSHILKGKPYSPADLTIYCIVRDLLNKLEGIDVGDIPSQYPSLYAIHQPRNFGPVSF
eukprot:Blabericola_migrator_1__4449@NODE_2381_length_2849_cov_419_265996_g1491_i0_p2_GENE_NODE_2381_length_2849_cov_419_265996_g1491_i0NODE_2381_length_2849_cov_419_265996_g1491_i0_p2_ORF_typecomplete_len202_score28_38GST_N/PF02798_20/3_9e12GST_N_3/PF13417_6/2_6e06GST_C_3/PF14497_6/0_0076Tom37/PF10568_9/0_25_NODE_2381_length_2849_cov_419_265996_g1491_i0264869